MLYVYHNSVFGQTELIYPTLKFNYEVFNKVSSHNRIHQRTNYKPSYRYELSFFISQSMTNKLRVFLLVLTLLQLGLGCLQLTVFTER